jgi:hypothetical protein
MMTDHAMHDEFEREIAEALERFVAPAVDHRSAREIADVALRPRGLGLQARDGSQRRLLLLGLAAAFLVPVAYLAILAIRTPEPQPPADVAVFVRGDGGATPGVSVAAVRPDGDELVIRSVPYWSVPGGRRIREWGLASPEGWLALAVTERPFPMALIDLRDKDSEPWLVEEANLAGISPSWGPTGLVAAQGADGLVVIDAEAREVRPVSMQGRGLVGGGPSIVWSEDGRGIVGSSAGGSPLIVPLDGGIPATVKQVFDPSGVYGSGLAELRVCGERDACPGALDGRVERVEQDGSARTIWRQDGQNRALAAGFGDRPNEYWLTVDRDAGRRIAVVHVDDEYVDTVATIDRAPDWHSVGAPIRSPDGSTLVLWVYQDPDEGAVIVPLDNERATFHTGHFAGFVDGLVAATFAGQE